MSNLLQQKGRIIYLIEKSITTVWNLKKSEQTTYLLMREIQYTGECFLAKMVRVLGQNYSKAQQNQQDYPALKVHNREKLIATTNRREGVYNRAGEPSVTFCE